MSRSALPVSKTDSTATASDLLALAGRARLLSDSRIVAISGKLRRNVSAAGLADQLVKDGELTPFQAKKLLAGYGQGLVIGRFKILKPIGRGGMGVVYLAEDTKNANARVALKILPPRKAAAEPRTKARFLREVKIGRELPKDPNIARVHETGIVDGVAYIAMEFVPGRTVKNVVTSSGALTVDVAARVFTGVANGLAASHAKGYIHRDVKPSNIVITPEGTAKLVDFGFALKINESDGDPGVVGGAGYALGTFDFIPPEQIANAVAVTPLADQYSLGCSMYFALAAQPPFPGGTPQEKMQKHRWEDPLPLSSHRPDLPVQFTAIVEKLMSKQPKDRFKSCTEVGAALAPWATVAKSPTSSSFFEDEFTEADDLDQFTPTGPSRRVYRRGQATYVLTALVLILIVIVLMAVLLIVLSK